MSTRYRTLCSPFSGGTTLGGGGSTAAGPVITVHPANQTVTEPAAFTMSVTATGTAPLTYQWFRGSTLLSGQVSSSISLATKYPDDHGASFSCRVTDANGRNVQSYSGVLTVNPGGSLAGPTFTLHPVNTSLVEKTAGVSLTAIATGVPAVITYQWYEYLSSTWLAVTPGSSFWSGPGWAGATTQTLTLSSSLLTGDSGRQFRCKATNTGGSTYSNAATITVTADTTAAVLVVTQPGAITITGQTVTVSTGAVLTKKFPSAWAPAITTAGFSYSTSLDRAYDASPTTWGVAELHNMKGSGGQAVMPGEGDGTLTITFSGWSAYTHGTAPSLKLVISAFNVAYGTTLYGAQDSPSFAVQVYQGGVLKASQTWASISDLETWKASNGGAVGPWTLTLTGLLTTTTTDTEVRVVINGKAKKNAYNTDITNQFQINDIYIEG